MLLLDDLVVIVQFSELVYEREKVNRNLINTDLKERNAEDCWSSKLGFVPLRDGLEQ